ncbi:MAG: hypothetical protein ACJASU_001789 [Cognaticolwellia sp.]|jgi:hypothetical protein
MNDTVIKNDAKVSFFQSKLSFKPKIKPDKAEFNSPELSGNTELKWHLTD